MAMDFESSRSSTRYRFGQLSKNMFFARHVAQPRYLRFITGAVGQRVCHVREHPIPLPVNPPNDLTISLMSDPRFCIDFAPDSHNETLLRNYSNKIEPKRRRERLLPPIPGWSSCGTVVEDTDNWRRELSRIAEMIGFVTSDELVERENRKETLITLPQMPPVSASKRPTSTGQYSRQSGRWNETPKSANRIRSASGRRTSLKPNLHNNLVCVDAQEREMWMLQVLCQILKTDNMTEIQSWLVSSGPNEKEAVRQLITTAIKGLEEGGRIQNQDQLNDTAKGVQVNMDSFGSLLANRFPHVSSTIPVTPPNENGSRPLSRPRTAPATQSRIQSRTDLQSKSTTGFQNNLETTNEDTEPLTINVETIVPEPTEIDVNRDIQVLTLDDIDTKSQLITSEKNDQIPF